MKKHSKLDQELLSIIDLHGSIDTSSAWRSLLRQTRRDSDESLVRRRLTAMVKAGKIRKAKRYGVEWRSVNPQTWQRLRREEQQRRANAALARKLYLDLGYGIDPSTIVVPPEPEYDCETCAGSGGSHDGYCQDCDGEGSSAAYRAWEEAEQRRYYAEESLERATSYEVKLTHKQFIELVAKATRNAA